MKRKAGGYCIYCGLDMYAKDIGRECPACDGDLCERKARKKKDTVPR